MERTTYIIFAIMIILSGCIVWIYYTLPPDVYVPAVFDKNIARQAMGEKNIVKVFYIAPNDNGQNGKLVGCGDSVVSVNKEIPATTTPLYVAMALLLGDKKKDYGESGLYNSLYQSDLRIKSIDMKDDVATINLTGSIALGGVCDNPRFGAQLEETAMQFSAVKEVNFFINGKSLESALSLK